MVERKKRRPVPKPPVIDPGCNLIAVAPEGMPQTGSTALLTILLGHHVEGVSNFLHEQARRSYVMTCKLAIEKGAAQSRPETMFPTAEQFHADMSASFDAYAHTVGMFSPIPTNLVECEVQEAARDLWSAVDGSGGDLFQRLINTWRKNLQAGRPTDAAENRQQPGSSAAKA